MNAFALHGPSDRFAGLRWGGSAVAIVAVHAALIMAGIAWYQQKTPAGSSMPTILIDMAPVSAAPEPQPMDVAPGPQMQQADAPSPPPEPMVTQPPSPIEEQLPPTPLMEKPVVEAPPEQKIEPARTTPEPEKISPDPPNPVITKPVTAKPVFAKPKPVRPPAKKQSEAPPAPRTSAPARAERQGRAASVATLGSAAAAAALPSYRDRLAAHLQRFKQYPADAKATGKQGVAMLSFTVGRGGQGSGQPPCRLERCRSTRRRDHGDASARSAAATISAGADAIVAQLYRAGALLDQITGDVRMRAIASTATV